MEIHYYSDSRGRQEVLEWFDHVKKHDKVAYRKFYQMQVYLKENGHLINSGEISRKDIKKLKGTDVWQLRINENRVLFFYFENNAIIFTNQFQKKQDDTPRNEIERAERRKDDWLKNLLN
ncbi:hypothetical protein CN692_08785 [Bacillus sp. AFS002410]|uniref:type II toxin-antitoxin system RelE/ParE family toxin n=1 Tax=Bacillus sp. AFS002410 TaxID=2033481 RepID=UPI000BF1BE6E|nr:type II toxin-antitoxin system RelE/ParE family toxin [Bacillus sp. AFS002410]PEJ58359.1 hypothetical protein CN692_08785 [Bacillus sp. AFS002410]